MSVESMTAPKVARPWTGIAGVLVRSGDWAQLFDLELEDRTHALRRYCVSAVRIEEPIGQVWLIPADVGGPIALEVVTERGPWDDEDRAVETVRFEWIARSGWQIAGRAVIFECSYCVDGRS